MVGAPVMLVIVPGSYFIFDKIFDHDRTIMFIFSNFVCISLWGCRGYILVLGITMTFYAATQFKSKLLIWFLAVLLTSVCHWLPDFIFQMVSLSELWFNFLFFCIMTSIFRLISFSLFVINEKERRLLINELYE